MRYIDADALLNRLPDALPYKASVKRVLIQAPTADVAREIFGEVDKILTIITIDDDEGFVGVNFDKYRELKKKYTEGWR